MIFEIILTFIVFFAVKSIIFYMTDIKGLPEFINYKPYCCAKCFTFWSLMLIYPTIFYISNYTWYYLLIVGILLTGLDTAAKHIDENNNIVTIDEI
jgi:hypothetical protein